MKNMKKRVMRVTNRHPAKFQPAQLNNGSMENPAVVNKSLYPAISYWLALTTPNGAPANPITVHKKLLKHGVSVTANKVKNHVISFMNVKIDFLEGY